VSLLSVSSGMPLGLVVTAVPAWLALAGVDIKTIGLITLAQVPWAFKFVWSPLMDWLRPPFLGFRRGWVFLCQLVLAGLTGALGFLATRVPLCEPKAAGEACAGAMPAQDPLMVGAVAGMTLLIAFAAASQDIAYDAYAVEVLEKDEQGAAVGARSALYRLGMLLSGSIAITLGPVLGWEWTLLLQAVIYGALLPVTIFAPEPKREAAPPRTLRDALWLPFVGFLGRPRALEITAFVLFYRLVASVADALVSPFLVQKGFSPLDVGLLRGVMGVSGTLFGTFFGGVVAARIGVGKALWIFGVLQIVVVPGFALVSALPLDLGVLPYTHLQLSSLLLQLVIFLETSTNGMTWGAFGVLLLRLTDKRFSATQYALFSSLVGLARTFVGPVAGILADSLGWTNFFLVTMLFGVPGLLLLRRFVPWGQEPKEVTGESLEPLPPGPPWGARVLWASGLAGALTLSCSSLLLSGLMAATKQWRKEKLFDFVAAMERVTFPSRWADTVDLASAIVFGVVGGFAVAAYLAAKGRPVAGVAR